MKKTIIFAVFFVLLISISGFSMAESKAPVELDRIITEEEFVRLNSEVLEYQKKVGREELTIKEVDLILKKLKVEGVKVFKEDTVSTQRSITLEVDNVFIDFFKIQDTASLFQVTFAMKNNDLIDTHDHYYGTIDGYSEVAYMSGTFVKRITKEIEEILIRPQSLRTMTNLSITNYGGRAYFVAAFYVTDGGVTGGPHFNYEHNYRY